MAAQTMASLSTIAHFRSKADKPRKTMASLSTLDPRIGALEHRRANYRIPHYGLCAAAGVSVHTWRLLRNGGRIAHGKTIDRLLIALERLIKGGGHPPGVIAAFVRVAEHVVLNQIGCQAELIVALTFTRWRRRRSPVTVAGARVRRVAIYLASVELEVSNAELARALGITRQNVKQARDMVEDLRERPIVDELLERCRALLKGGKT